MMQTNRSVLNVSKLSVDIEGRERRRILSEISFTLEADNVLGIIGQSGSGKTVLSRALVNWLRPPLRISGGSIFFKGVDLATVDEAAMQQMLQHALPLTVRQYRRDRLLVARVRQLLATAPDMSHNAAQLAERLHVSTRTLHRQLKEEGATLQALKDEVRQSRAVDLLRRTRQPIKQVAEAAGFASEKSFIRAFRTWTGHSPAQFRRQGIWPDSSPV